MSDKRRVLVLTSDAGLGHRTAAEAIASALEDRYRDRCQVDVVNPAEHERAPKLLLRGESDYDRVVQHVSTLYRVGYDISDSAAPTSLLEGLLTVAAFLAIRDIVAEHEPHVIVSTTPLYQGAVGAANALRERRVPLITVITDLVTIHRIWFSEAADLYIVPTEEARSLALSAGIGKERVKILGIPVHPDFAERPDPAIVRTQLGWNTDLPTLLAVGGKRVQHIMPALQALDRADLRLQMAMVAGGDDRLYERLQEQVWHGNSYVYDFVDNMPDMMHASDMIMCKAGGLIVSESLACGLPMLLVDVIPGQEEGNASFVSEHGAGNIVDSPSTAVETVQRWLENEADTLAKCSQNARELGRPRAAFDIADEAWGLASEMADRRILDSRNRSAVMELLDRYEVPWRHS